MTEWHRCEDLLPAQRGSYLVILKYQSLSDSNRVYYYLKTARFGSAGRGRKKNWTGNQIYKAKDIIYWRPLPEFPDELFNSLENPQPLPYGGYVEKKQ